MVRTTAVLVHRLGRTAWARWAVTSNDRAVANARAASVECSRRLVERLEVDLFVEHLRRDADRPRTATRLAH